MFVQLGVAQVRTAGVSEGDWFKYGFSFELDSKLNMSSEDFPFAEFLEGEWVTLTMRVRPHIKCCGYSRAFWVWVVKI
jgi:hypothetical protein